MANEITVSPAHTSMELLSIYKAAQLPLILQTGISWEMLRRLIREKKIRSVDLSKENCQRRNMKTTELWIIEGLQALGYPVVQHKPESAASVL